MGCGAHTLAGPANLLVYADQPQMITTTLSSWFMACLCYGDMGEGVLPSAMDFQNSHETI